MPDVDARAFVLDPSVFAAALSGALRRGGLQSTPERAAWLVEALRAQPPRTRAELYWACRVVFMTSQQQLERFDAVFEAVFGGGLDAAAFRGDRTAPDASTLRRRTSPDIRDASSSVRPVEGGMMPAAAPGSRDAAADRDSTDALLLAMSHEERLHDTAFDALSPDEIARMRRLVAALVLATPERPGRRVRVSRAGDRLDLRRTVRAARRTGGHPAILFHGESQSRPRPLVLLCDISASMEPYTRVLLSLLQAAVVSGRAEAFVFATRLTRLTRQLGRRDPDLALARAAEATSDWAGGTRLADGIRSFIDVHGRRGLARGAVVVILSDGWSQDDPAEIERQMLRLSRLAHRIVWVNPRRAARGYEPLAGGMAAALPYCDAFVSGHSYTALQDLVRVIADDPARPAGTSAQPIRRRNS